jgi:hypothetical protein
MDNPWLRLPEHTPFLLECDKHAISRFNATARDDYFIHSEELPEPYTGRPTANIVLLNLNPGFYERNEEFHSNGSYNYFLKTHRANLAHAASDYPFYHLDPNNSSSPGYYWWGRKLKQLINEYGVKKVAYEVCNFEYFPYHSRHFGYSKSIIESQKYTFYLVEQALQRNAIVIMMRARTFWEQAVPLLKTYPYHTLNSAQSASISEKNCPNGYQAIVEALK